MSEKHISCQTCVLNSGVPDVTIDSSGSCTICNNYKKLAPHEPAMRKYLLQEMENLFTAVKKKKRPYHAMVLFSGGKDSTFLLKMAKEKYNLRTLAVSVIHPLVNETAKKNMEDAARKLNVELLKIYPGEEVYKKCIRLGLLKGREYGLGEFFGCNVCSFFHSWLPIRYAINMDIPIILEGSDLSQTGEITYHQPINIKNEALKGKKPFGRVHDLVMDALGEEYKGSIYDYDEEEMIQKPYPTIISPFSFMDYDYRNNLIEIESMGLQSKSFRSIFTNCSATPFFSYFSLHRFGCVSYIKHYATEVRRGYPNLMKHSLEDDFSGSNALSRELIEKLMEEYKNVVLYVGENKLTEATITEAEKEKLRSMAPNYLELFGEKVCDVFLYDALQIPILADYFGVKLESVN